MSADEYVNKIPRRRAESVHTGPEVGVHVLLLLGVFAKIVTGYFTTVDENICAIDEL
ncbi:Uncharacterised protein [Actinobaculum suis]|uniref:Uncharacterized protein n=1 Tax=Actinobaculum suis TaxID=1657 RepID=A0A7Z8Y9W0_9ACTO|nr:Uncharacterised protein [Actinobaculum suis]